MLACVRVYSGVRVYVSLRGNVGVRVCVCVCVCVCGARVSLSLIHI